MPSSKNSIFYNGNLEIDRDSLNQIIQSVICFSDYVWVNCAARPSSRLSTEDNERIGKMLKELEGRGGIKTWGYPHQRRAGVKIIGINEYRQTAEKINETFFAQKELLPTVSYSFRPSDGGKGGIETTSKIISERKEYWSLALADLLQSDRLMMGPEYKTIWPQRPLKMKYSTAEGRIIDRVLSDFLHIPDLTFLNAQEVMRLQGLSKPFRRKIEEICKFDFSLDAKELEKQGSELTDGIWDFFPKTDVLSLGKDIGKEAVYTVAAYIHPILATLPFGKRFLDWFSTRRKMGFAIFMSEMKRAARKKGN